MDFVRNAWYVAGFSTDVGPQPIGRVLLEEPLVLYRTEAGRLVALHNRCLHRSYPLSLGRVVGDCIECGYHGFTYDPTGKCVLIPSQPHIPPRTRVLSYPVVERVGVIWVWMGDPALADESLVPNTDWLQKPGCVTMTGLVEVKAHYQLIVDNLLDLTHVTYLHPETIGQQEVCETPARTEVDGRTVRVTRVMPRIPLPPNHPAAVMLHSPIDRYQLSEFVAPAMVRIQGLQRTADNPQEEAVAEVMHAMTPSTSDTTLYFYAACSNVPENEAAQRRRLEFVLLQQDVPAVEAQQAMLAQCRDQFQINTAADEGSIKARRIVKQLLEAEASAQGEGAMRDQSPLASVAR